MKGEYTHAALRVQRGKGNVRGVLDLQARRVNEHGRFVLLREVALCHRVEGGERGARAANAAGGEVRERSFQGHGAGLVVVIAASAQRKQRS